MVVAKGTQVMAIAKLVQFVIYCTHKTQAMTVNPQLIDVNNFDLNLRLNRLKIVDTKRIVVLIYLFQAGYPLVGRGFDIYFIPVS
jgi:hypothetical protein